MTTRPIPLWTVASDPLGAGAGWYWHTPVLDREPAVFIDTERRVAVDQARARVQTYNLSAEEGLVGLPSPVWMS